ncbi:hypothetical protein CL656_04785 [bacterium]|nr:hypothetical protein [bacterium]|tara:strand:- start:2560 stop:4161 length:1602 start_codon:yes stop_codon:yes gene_type:complete
MLCKISCSFGEIIDKITILKIKLSKANKNETIKNIKNELETITKETPLSTNNDTLFDELHIINNKLWILEDLIREKSKNKIFDDNYILISENIHKYNDERYNIKKKINLKYDSTLIEEKIYKTDTQIICDKDLKDLNDGKNAYTNGEYKLSYNLLKSLIEKYKNYEIYDNFYVDLIFSYENILTIYNYENEYNNKLHKIMDNIDELEIISELKDFCKNQYLLKCLHMKNYKKAYKYINRINFINGPNVTYKNMSFFKKGDKNKKLLIYDGGGLGDKFMLCRFIPKLCNDYKDNTIIFFVNDQIVWILNIIFKDYENLFIIPYNFSHLLDNFDYHCSLLYLIKCLNIDYDNLWFEPMLKNISIEMTEKNKNIINEIKNNENKTYILNWKGNTKNPHEKSNRSMELKYAIPLFNLTNINWIVLTKDITFEERIILSSYEINYIGDDIDTNSNTNCFEDTIGILKNVDGIISTDTSLVHLSANLNVNTYVLLTTGCEWRWGQNNTTKWYPSTKLIRQDKQGDWESVINKLIKYENL